MRRCAGIIGIVTVVACLLSSASFASGSAAQAKSSLSVASQYQTVLKQYCIGCHNQKLKTAGLALDAADISKVSDHPEIWEKVAGKLRRQDMPPAGRPRPDQATYQRLDAWLENSLDEAARTKPNPGRPQLHRLNRTEYANAIRDLLALDIDVESLLPPDDSTHGFDNIADVLGISPLLFESYMRAAEKISRVAVGDPTIAAIAQTYRAPADLTQDYHLDGLPLWTRGGMEIRHNFPVQGEYAIKIALKRNVFDAISGLQDSQILELALDRSRIKAFQIGGPETYKKKGTTNASDALNDSFTADAGLKVRIPVSAGPHTLEVTFQKESAALDEGFRQPYLNSSVDPFGHDGLAHVASVTIDGPYDPRAGGDTPSRRRIFTCRPDRQSEATCAKAILARLARRAFRQPVSAKDLQTLIGFYETGRHDGNFESGIAMALQVILTDPKFLFRVERAPGNVVAGVPHAISDLELASRLSFFLWSSIPDDVLLNAAARGTLRQPAVLQQQVQRMLADPRAFALVTNFAGQWLQTRNLKGALPNPTIFPDFDDNLRQGFRRETDLFFESIIKENRSVLDLLDADYTFVNERLARHYGIPNVYGDRFRRVRITDENRRGLLGQGSILTVTSYPTRTSPVLRGKWILATLLGTPPPPPPPNVPELKEVKKAGGKLLPIRERMAEHRKNAVCASCHARMDPLGFALENFDAVGAWRNDDDGSPIDAGGGVLSNGTPFNGPVELRKALLSDPESFVRTVTAKLLTYALGRGLEYYDNPVIRQVVHESARTHYSFESLILGIVKSTPFQMRQEGESSPATTTITTASKREGSDTQAGKDKP